MKAFILVILIIASTSSFAEDWSGDIYKNIREANSQYISFDNQQEIKTFNQSAKDMDILLEILRDPKLNRCASKWVNTIKNEFAFEDTHQIEVAILAMRSKDWIDDMTVSLLLRVLKLEPSSSIPSIKGQLSTIQEDIAMSIYQKWNQLLKAPQSCQEDVYRSMVSDLQKEDAGLVKNLKYLTHLAYEKNILSKNTYKQFEILRQQKVHLWPTNLRQYGETLNALSKHFPNRAKESSKIVTQVLSRQKLSLRQNLFVKYDSTQIMLLSHFIKDLKARLDSKDIVINISYENRDTEIISLSPMEKFRFLLKLLRRELAVLNNGSLLNFQSATYPDLIAASYEVGIISSFEIEQLLLLEEIWNPKKTPKEKIFYWIKTFGSSASVLLPPPFGFVSVMALMIIDQQISEAPIDHSLDFILF